MPVDHVFIVCYIVPVRAEQEAPFAIIGEERFCAHCTILTHRNIAHGVQMNRLCDTMSPFPTESECSS